MEFLENSGHCHYDFNMKPKKRKNVKLLGITMIFLNLFKVTLKHYKTMQKIEYTVQKWMLEGSTYICKLHKYI